jgi:hypothetical protein
MTHGAQSPQSPPPKFLVDSVLPANEVHLLYGPISEEITLFCLQNVATWLEGEEILAHASYPQPACYVACGHSLASLRWHMERADIDPGQLPHLSMLDHVQHEDRTVDSALRLARAVVPNLRLLILDGMYTLCPGHINFFHDASKFLIATTQLCKEQRITILGCVTAVKSRDGESQASARDRLPGSIAWATLTSTKILFEPNRIDRYTDDTRRAVVMATALERTITLQYVRQGYRFEYRGEGIAHSDLDTWLLTLHPGTPLTTQDLRDVAERSGISKASLYRWLADQIALGTILKIAHGSYVTPDSPPPSN